MHTSGKTPGGKVRWRCSKIGAYCYSTTELRSGESTPARRRNGKAAVNNPIFTRELGASSTLIVTSAQNATPVHPGFLGAMESHANAVSGDILVVPLRYKNPTSRWSRSQANAEVWSPSITPLLCNTRKRLNPNLMLMGDIKIEAAAGDPLAGLDALSHAQSGIFAHAKVASRTVPVPQGRYPKLMMTTGTCTMPNYTDSKRGKIAEFHHTLGALVVEIKGKRFHARHVGANKATGSYIDIGTLFETCMATRGPGISQSEALILGDWHQRFTAKSVEEATFGPGGMVEVLQPKRIIWHDLADGYSVNHHHRGNWVLESAKARLGMGDVGAEMQAACQYVARHTPYGVTSVIVPSNHNEFLGKWVQNTDPRTLNAENRRVWMDCTRAMDDSAKLTGRGIEYVDAFVHFAKEYFRGQDNFVVLQRGESYVVAGYELGLHFDKGPNGSRGSLRNLRRLGIKTIGGHGHGPGRNEGGTQVGTSTGELEYGIGSPSGWLNSHGEINAHGRVTLHTMIGNQWRVAP